MGLPTRAQVESGWSNAIKLIDQTWLYGSKNATNFVALLQTLQPLLFGDYSADAAGTAQALRSLLAGAVSRPVIQTLMRPFMKMYCQDVIGRTDLTTDAAMLAEIYKFFVDNRLRVTGRGITYGTPTAKAGNIGTVQLTRLTQDRKNFPIESCMLDAKRCRCIVDQNTGAQGQGAETWYLEGQTPGPDDLIRSGSGLTQNITGLTADDSKLSNADFRNFTATTPVVGGLTTTLTDITDWTCSPAVSGTTYQLDNLAGNIFRVPPSNSLANCYSLVLLATALMTQKLSLRNTKLDLNTPYNLAIVWNRQIAAASGTLKIRMGNTETVVAVAAQTGWQVTQCPPSRGWSNWYEVFAQDDLQIAIDWTSSGGSLYIAEILLVPGTPATSNFGMDGWFWMLPNSTAKWAAPRVNDEFNFSDLVTGADGKNQRTMAYGFPGFYFPSAVGSGITFSDA